MEALSRSSEVALVNVNIMFCLNRVANVLYDGIERDEFSLQSGLPVMYAESLSNAMVSMG